MVGEVGRGWDVDTEARVFGKGKRLTWLPARVIRT